MEQQWILAWLLIMSMFTVVYGIARVSSDMIPLIPVEKPPKNFIQQYSMDEKCQRGLNFLIALNNMWLSNSKVPATEQVQDRRCTTGNSDVIGVTLTIRVSLIL